VVGTGLTTTSTVEHTIQLETGVSMVEMAPLWMSTEKTISGSTQQLAVLCDLNAFTLFA
jgi:hypothetical protein